MSDAVGCEMKFGVFLPPSAQNNPKEKLPVLYFLSGLTCTEANFTQKSGFQRYAAEHNLIVVNPDTSPRGLSIEGEDDSYDFGSGAGFYLDATEEKWKKNYRMYSYIVDELLSVVAANFAVDTSKQGITGHSMGGHGALTIALKNPGTFASVSAFAPISNPMECPWGVKAFTGYLGSDRSTWAKYDATHLVKEYNGPPLDVLVDQGDQDDFLKNGQLLPDNLLTASVGTKVKLQLRMQEGYDHSYFFISTFIGDHIQHHATHLNKKN
uniref:S-formylglutathione hydrolase n=2 Tax=Plectus sambesii TaxID=2011161 RepID=A0A914XND6_9BILA